MKETLPSNKLLALSDFLDKNMGLYYPEKAWSGFEKKLPEIAKALGFTEVSKCVDYLLERPVTHELICTLAKHLTIGETYFFREIDLLNKIMSKIISPLINERQNTSKSLRIWSAACCTGEEPYTLAMMLTQLIPNYKLWNISILGTDINLEFLKSANEGKYRDWSFRNTDVEMKKKFFIKNKDYYELVPDIKRMVHFSHLNLVEDNYPSLFNGTTGIDLIICNNVLIYFSESQIKKVTNQLGHCLTDNGYLVVTAIESPFVNVSHLTHSKELGGNFFHKKNLEFKLKKKVSFSIPNIDEKILTKKTSLKEPVIIETSKSKNENELLIEANYHFFQGDYQQTIEIIRDKTSEKDFINDKIFIKNIKLVSLLIKSYANLGMIDKSFEICEKYLKKYTIEPVLYYLYAVILQELGDSQGAIKSLKKALFLDSEFVIAYFTLANILLIRSDFNESKKNFKNVQLILEKHDPDWLIPEGEGLTCGRLKEMIQDIEKRMNDEDPL